MTSIQRLNSLALLALLGAAAAIACAADPDVELGTQMPPDSTSVPDASAALDSGEDAADADAGMAPCSASGLCVVPAPIDTRINVTSVSGSGAKDVWAVGTDRTILHYDGKVWDKADTIPNDAASFTMRAVWVGGPGDIWVTDGPRLRHSTGWKGPSATEWESVLLVDPNTMPSAISGNGTKVMIGSQLVDGSNAPFGVITACSGWSDGGLREPVYVQNQLFHNFGADGLWTMAMTGPNEAWGVTVPRSPGPGTVDPGNGIARAYRVSPDGGAEGAEAPWQTDLYDSRTGKNLYGVWGDEHAVWVVGEGGTLRRMLPENLSTRVFENVISPVTADLRGIYGFAADDIWAVGDDATVIHWNGKDWTRLASPFDTASAKPRLFAVWGSAPNDVWIGGNGVMLHFEGKAP